MELIYQLLIAGVLFNVFLYAFLKYVDDAE